MSIQKTMNESDSKNMNDEIILNDTERDTLGEIGNICMGTCATTLSTLLGKRVTITTPKVTICKSDEFLDEYEKPLVVAEVSYTEGIEGNNIFIIKKEDALLITGVLMGNDGSIPEEELSEYYLSAMSEVMNQMVGSAATALADIMQTLINISPPVVNEISKGESFKVLNFNEESYVRTSFRMEIEGLFVSNIMSLIPAVLGKKLAGLLLDDKEESIVEVQIPDKQIDSLNMPSNEKDSQSPVNIQDKKKVNLKAVKYQSFNNIDEKMNCESQESHKNIDLIMDVPLQVTVVLGRCKKTIKEILETGVGSVVVLDRFAGEMVDVLVNGKLFARGEVVVIDDNYGVRITELIADHIPGTDDKHKLLGMVGGG